MAAAVERSELELRDVSRGFFIAEPTVALSGSLEITNHRQCARELKPPLSR
jgi:hypothetical protein